MSIPVESLLLNILPCDTDLQDDEVRALAEEDAAAKELLSAARDVIARLLVVAPKRRKDDASRVSRPKPPKWLLVSWTLRVLLCNCPVSAA